MVLISKLSRVHIAAFISCILPANTTTTDNAIPCPPGNSWWHLVHTLPLSTELWPISYLPQKVPFRHIHLKDWGFDWRPHYIFLHFQISSPKYLMCLWYPTHWYIRWYAEVDHCSLALSSLRCIQYFSKWYCWTSYGIIWCFSWKYQFEVSP